jgi:hypothetical protein
VFRRTAIHSSVNQVATPFARDRGVAIEACVGDARAIRDWLVPSQAPRSNRPCAGPVADISHTVVAGMAWL